MNVRSLLPYSNLSNHLSSINTKKSKHLISPNFVATLLFRATRKEFLIYHFTTLSHSKDRLKGNAMNFHEGKAINQTFVSRWSVRYCVGRCFRNRPQDFHNFCDTIQDSCTRANCHGVSSNTALGGLGIRSSDINRGNESIINR